MKLRLALLLILIIASVFVTQSSALAQQKGPYIRFANFTQETVDFYADSKPVVMGLASMQTSPYMPFDKGITQIVAVKTTEALEKSLTSDPFAIQTSLANNGYFTVVLMPNGAGFMLMTLPQDGPVVAVGEASSGHIKVTGAFIRATAQMAGTMGGNMDHMATAEATMAMGMMSTPEATMAMGGMDHMGSMSGKVTAGYMLITNSGDTPDRLVAIKSDIAGLIELHESVVENDVAIMRPLANGIEVPAGGSAELKRGGMHIMFMDLKKDLYEGDVVSITLMFESGLELKLEVPVKAITM